MTLNRLTYALCAAIWIAALFVCYLSSNPRKLSWMAIIIVLPFLGSILDFLLGKRTDRNFGQDNRRRNGSSLRQ